MGCCLELGLLAWGAYLACAGQFTLPGGRAIRGGMVRVAGVIFALPLPLSFIIGLFIGISEGLKGRTRISKDWIGVLGLMELGIIGGCVALGGLILAFASFGPTERPRRRDEWGHDMEFPYVAEQRRKIDFDEVFETHGPALPPPASPPPLPEHAQAVVAERPAPAPSPRPVARDESFLESEFPRPRGERR